MRHSVDYDVLAASYLRDRSVVSRGSENADIVELVSPVRE